MFGLLFLGLGITFFWLVFKAYSSGEIMARGWGFGTRIYSRDGEPVRYWFTFCVYMVCAVWSTVFAVVVFRSPG